MRTLRESIMLDCVGSSVFLNNNHTSKKKKKQFNVHVVVSVFTLPTKLIVYRASSNLLLFNPFKSIIPLNPSPGYC